MTKKRIFTLLILLTGWVLLYINLQRIADFIVFGLLRMESGKHLTESIRFFIFEVPKVMLLLVLIIFLVGIVRSFFSPEKTRKALEGKSLFTGNVMASAVGIVTPFCSCSAIPLFLGFVEAGIPAGFDAVKEIVGKIWIYILIGIAIGAGAHGFVPDDFLARALGA